MANEINFWVVFSLSQMYILQLDVSNKIGVISKFMSTSKSLNREDNLSTKMVYPSHFVFSALSSPPFEKLLKYQDTTNTFIIHMLNFSIHMVDRPHSSEFPKTVQKLRKKIAVQNTEYEHFCQSLGKCSLSRIDWILKIRSWVTTLTSTQQPGHKRNV